MEENGRNRFKIMKWVGYLILWEMPLKHLILSILSFKWLFFFYVDEFKYRTD